MNRTSMFRPEAVVNDRFWPWVAAMRSGGQIFPMNTPAPSQQVPMETPRSNKTPYVRGGGGGGRRGGRKGGRGGAGEALPAPQPSQMTSRTTDVLPSAAEATNLPNLTGEVGKVAFRARQQSQSAAMTNPQAVAPGAMGLNEPARRSGGAAVSTMVAPDAGVYPAAAAMDRQLPNKEAYIARDQQANEAAAMAAQQTIASGGGGEPAAPKRRRMFRAQPSDD